MIKQKKSSTSQTGARRGGLYWLNGKPYLSVTTILQCIDKPALRYWYGQMVYQAMVADPSLDEKSALAAPYKASTIAKTRGTNTHDIIEVWEHDKAQIAKAKPETQPYLHAFYDFVQDHNIEIISHEKTVINEECQYAGTLDLKVRINGGKPALIDVKTSKKGIVYIESGLQLSAYKNCEPDVEDIYTLALSEKGLYTFQKMPYDIDAFLAAKKLYEYLNIDYLKVVGYLK